MYLSQAKIDEGWVPRVYKNYKGFRTLGYGHLVTPNTQKVLTDIGVSQARARRLLADTPRTTDVLTKAEGEALLHHDVSRKEKELRYMLKNYDKLTNEQKTGLLGLRFRGDFAMYDKGGLSKEYKHARAGRYDLAAREMRRRVKDAPIGVRKRVERHTQPLLSSQKTRSSKGVVIPALLLAISAAWIAKRRRPKTIPQKTISPKTIPQKTPNHKESLTTHPLVDSVSVPSKKTTSRKNKRCAAGKERNPKTGRCVKACVPNKQERNPKTGRCVNLKNLKNINKK